ncbi:efflux RND transporter permease subunit [Granulosicoccaceae sp. 1_MG-2023]|nr:efflux RND transporter permease subunit [Granulosicoccaceae sp. 1_MG-2023]
MIAWFARNHVAANLLMLAVVGLGLYSMFNRVLLEVFPSVEVDTVSISVSFPGATPQEVEEAVTIRIEEAVQDLNGIDRMTSSSSEGSASVRLEVMKGVNPRDFLDDVKNRIDSLSTLPDDAEIPRVSLAERQREVISVALYGHTDEAGLRQIGDRVRDELLALPGITQVEPEAVRPYEISIEVAESTLRRYGLTLQQVADQISNSSLDLSAGNLRGDAGELLVRTTGQAYAREDFLSIPVITDASGTQVRLADIAQIRDGFNELPIRTRFNGKPGLLLEVYRVGDQSAIEVAAAVRNYINTVAWLPDGVDIKYWRDRSKLVKARLKTLTDNAMQGGILVILLLSLFLRPTVAFWVCLGIPIAFLGSFIVLPELGVTLNIVSLFAFIVVLGIVVDDAIVTGENVYTHLQRGSPPLQAAIDGTREVAVPVTFGVLTTVAAFVPIAMIGGARGPVFAQIPLVVIPVLLFSLIESKLILPAHLKHVRVAREAGQQSRFSRLQQGISNALERGIQRFYGPLLAVCLRNKVLTLAAFIGVALIVYALAFGGWIRFVFFPRVQAETARAYLTMPAGTPFDVTDVYIQRMTDAASELREKHKDGESGDYIIRDIYSTTGSMGGYGVGQSNIGRVVFEISPPEERHSKITSAQLVREWRQMIGPVPGAESLTYRAELGRSSDPIDVQILGRDLDDLRAFGTLVRGHLAAYPGVFDIEDSLSGGKREIRIELKPAAALLGVRLADIARQVRQALYGLEVQRIQRDRDEVKVFVRYPAQERRTVADLRNMLIRTADGNAVPFDEVASLSESRAPASIERIDRQRSLNITADANKESVDIEAIKRGIDAFVREHIGDYPGLSYSLEGEAAEQRESLGTLKAGLVGALFVIYCLLAIPFRSYFKPLIVMSIIPFGAVGAVLGHLIMGMSLSISSAMGALALVGVVVNDSLVLVDYINRRCREGVPVLQAAQTAGVARFRAVILTSLTTFFGLMPLLFEKSTQAQFLIPMAVSLGFGILFATVITLILIPVNYVIYDHIRSGIYRLAGKTAPLPGAQDGH